MATANLSFSPPPYAPSALVIVSVLVSSTGQNVTGSSSLSGSGQFWVLTIAEPSPGLVYLYNLTATIAGTPTAVSGTVTGTLSTPTSIYPNVYTTLINKYGVNNIANWSNKGNDTTNIDLLSVQNAINVYENAFNNFWNNGPYNVPLTPPNFQITDWVVTGVAWWLYLNRGFADQDTTGMKLAKEFTAAQSQMAMYKGLSSTFVLPCSRRWPSPTAAVATGRSFRR